MQRPQLGCLGYDASFSLHMLMALAARQISEIVTVLAGASDLFTIRKPSRMPGSGPVNGSSIRATSGAIQLTTPYS
jgi:hypothetical protein